MASSIDLVCAEPTVQTALRAWLDEGRLDPPGPLALDVRIAQPPPDNESGGAVFEQPGVLVRSGAPRRGVRIEWTAAPAVALLPPGETTAYVTLSAAAAARIHECLRTFLLTVLIFLLRRRGWHHIHAATAVDPRGRGWLIAGDAHAGKSTTAALLAACGWEVGTDDVAFLTGAAANVAAVGLRQPIALRPGGHLLLRRRGTVQLPERRKVGYWPEDLGGRWVSRAEPRVILFTSVAERTLVTRAEPLARREALTELIRWSAWVMLEPEFAQHHLELLASLARQAQSYRVMLGRDLFAHPARLAALVA
ncbi:MAG TPA: hypothetical protein VFU46_13300 [Gemmatimonadales bacterium]|nr:hypothetical protein [Gemmatimonadales bacterium]